jgi:hypothetical protein
MIQGLPLPQKIATFEWFDHNFFDTKSKKISTMVLWLMPKRMSNTLAIIPVKSTTKENIFLIKPKMFFQ